MQESHIHRTIHLSIGTLLAASVFLALVALGCKKADPDAFLANDPVYKGWHVEVYENVRVYYPDKHARTNMMPNIARNFYSAYVSTSKTLGLPVPTDTLRVFYYTGWGQGTAITRHPYPFGDTGMVAQYWPPYAPGMAIAQLVIKRWDPDPPKMKFLYHGLIALFDFQGENFHRSTIQYEKDSKLIPLTQLAVDTVVNSDEERWQSAEGASFCAFFIGNYGLEALRSLYRTDLPIDQALLQIVGKPVDVIQGEWLEVARLASAENPKAAPDTTTQK
jgi:hypothetical protein